MCFVRGYMVALFLAAFRFEEKYLLSHWQLVSLCIARQVTFSSGPATVCASPEYHVGKFNGRCDARSSGRGRSEVIVPIGSYLSMLSG